MESTIKNEIALLNARLAQLEKEKNTPPPPKKTAEELLKQRLEAAKHNEWRKNESPVATACRFSRQSENEMLECIVESLNKINARLDALEKK
jgi:hypothetical protein